jgi:hypothetical protein
VREGVCKRVKCSFSLLASLLCWVVLGAVQGSEGSGGWPVEGSQTQFHARLLSWLSAVLHCHTLTRECGDTLPPNHATLSNHPHPGDKGEHSSCLQTQNSHRTLPQRSDRRVPHEETHLVSPGALCALPLSTGRGGCCHLSLTTATTEWQVQQQRGVTGRC